MTKTSKRLQGHASGCFNTRLIRFGRLVIEACFGLKGSPALGSRRCYDTLSTMSKKLLA
ncbi:hypothetical protein FOPG_16908 [Fusarium oxysporum f. sp. conglutinans race 2 54008]|uniref:Uncharacterized protein n=1 Tax=Fusarium oxysporum f. sp. conglutinans race 2 54008 TaxID=1089457 RepID=X0H4N9_FUSOX|nr:hypothetical protein FOPG_16908 [Fusarium oxysporum f. sp. conglutinans race 2 54008]